MGYKAVSYTLKSDFLRYKNHQQKSGIIAFIKIMIHERGFKFLLWFRLTAVKSPLKPLFWLIYRHYFNKYSIQVSTDTQIDGGFYIGHGIGVVIHPSAKIGKNVNISQFCTIGSNKGKAAVIGDGVYIGPSCCIVENVCIGKNAIIGAGSVVTKDIPANSVAVGSPARVIKMKKEK